MICLYDREIKNSVRLSACDGKKKNSKNKKKENKQTAPRNVWGADTNSESADAAVDIMSFFEQHAVDDED